MRSKILTKHRECSIFQTDIHQVPQYFNHLSLARRLQLKRHAQHGQEGETNNAHTQTIERFRTWSRTVAARHTDGGRIDEPGEHSQRSYQTDEAHRTYQPDDSERSRPAGRDEPQ